MKLTKQQLETAITEAGQYEEFYQRIHNGYMQAYHKAERLKLEAEYRHRFGLVGGRQDNGRMVLQLTSCHEHYHHSLAMCNECLLLSGVAATLAA